MSASTASFVAKLLMNEMPDHIEDAFNELNLHLLPDKSSDFKTVCSCPDWTNPCKHIARVYYQIASMIDYDPFLLFELRGISREELHQELMLSPLGKILSAGLMEKEITPNPVESYYTSPTLLPVEDSINPKEFWQGKKRIPDSFPESLPTIIPAITVKKAGDYPPFWHEERSFLEVMSEFYTRIRKKNQDFL